MVKPHRNARRKERPRSRIIADMSINFLERKVLRRGHRLIRIPEELDNDGTDAFMRTHHPATTFVEPGQVDFQLKATDQLEFVGNGEFVTCRIEMAHLDFWYYQTFFPFILVLYDARKHRAFWLDVKQWGDAHEEQFAIHRDQGKQDITLRIPVKNELSVYSIDRFRSMLLAKTDFAE